MFPSLRNAVLAFPNLAIMSWSAPPSDVTRLPRYVKDDVHVSCCPFSSMTAGSFMLRGMTSVFLMLILSPSMLAFFCSLDVLSCM